jgi:hypothetical protein
MPALNPTPNHPRRVGRLTSLATVVGCDTDGAPKRPTLIGNFPSWTKGRILNRIYRLNRLHIMTHGAGPNSCSRWRHKQRTVPFAPLRIDSQNGLRRRAGRSGWAVKALRVRGLASLRAFVPPHNVETPKSGSAALYWARAFASA